MIERAFFAMPRRRIFLQQVILLGLGMSATGVIFSGTQKEEYLSASVASAMGRSIRHSSPPHLIFTTQVDAKRWLEQMDKQLKKYVNFAYERHNILLNLQYEASRAGLDPQLILGLIEVESRFRRYAISAAGARGLMQVMPFWVRQIGEPWHNLFDMRTNLRYGCTILRHYLDIEHGNLFRALGRYNGSLGRTNYPNAVIRAARSHWLYNGAG